VGYNNPEGEALYHRRKESDWPLARTRYTKSFLTPDKKLVMSEPETTTCKLGYRALGGISDPQSISFRTAPFQTETEITSHIVVRLNISVSKDPYGSLPSDIGLFLTLRHLQGNLGRGSYN
jgi:predicted acyl esterase